jgi:hypothetical protein
VQRLNRVLVRLAGASASASESTGEGVQRES